ncbi:MAG: FAD-dependent oxidoreductase, partial [Deltaproteobacteria bacterium]|nr:FAD-dependent oxidoreductase [Deltaproteobacteria bacterium]
AKRAGFVAVEIHGGFCYLLAQFLSPFFNRRADEYGGNSTNRARFPLRIVGAIRESVGPAFPILFRLNADEFIDGGTTVEESRLYASLLEKASVDLIHVTAGSGFAVSRHIEPMSFEQGWKAYLAGEIKKAVSVPVAAVGNIKEPAVAEAVLQRGDADCIAIGRALLADPYWPLKAKNGARINRCISCNVCAGKRLAYDGPVRCSVNPFVGSEYREILRRPPARLRSVLIAGAGPAGMKAAAEAAKDGHTVILAERADRVGGRALMAAAPPHKEKALWLVEDLAAQIRQARVDLRLGVTVDRAYIESVRPDAVIVACGSESCLPPFLAGAAAERTVLAEDVLSGFPVSPSLTVGVIGGGSVGCECAELLAEAGNTVFIFEMRDAVAMDLDPISRADLLTRLAALNVAVRERHCFQNFTDGTLTCTFGCEQTRQAVDLLVPATGFRRPSALLETLQGSAYPHLVIGDAARPGRFVDATRQGRLAADWLGAPGLG